MTDLGSSGKLRVAFFNVLLTLRVRMCGVLLTLRVKMCGLA